jgi:hypothetical protein
LVAEGEHHMPLAAAAEHRTRWVAAPVSAAAEHRMRWAVAPVSAAAEHRMRWAVAPVSAAAEYHMRWAVAPVSVAEHRTRCGAARVSAAVDTSAALAPVVERVSAVHLTLAARVLAADLRYRGLRRGQVHTRVSEVSARLRIIALQTGAPAAQR